MSELRILELILPGGFEVFLERLSGELSTPERPSLAGIQLLAAEYGVDFDFESVANLSSRFGVTLDGWPTA